MIVVKNVFIIVVIIFSLFIIFTWSNMGNDAETNPSDYANYKPLTDVKISDPIIVSDDEKSAIIIDDEKIQDFGTKSITYDWSYNGYDFNLGYKFSRELFELYKERSRNREYSLFASDAYDDFMIAQIVDDFKKLGIDAGFDDSQIPYLVASFVQSMDYTSDSVTAGYDEYPRFPYETLFEKGGDCEDTAILTAALLQEMGYGVILIELPGHMAVGVACETSVEGYYYNHEGQRYCYLETTGENWNVGDMPEAYQGKSAVLHDIYKIPYLEIDFDGNMKTSGLDDVYTDVNVTVTNLGSETAKNVKIYVALQTINENKVWDSIESEYFNLESESSITYDFTNLHSPRGQDYRIYIQAVGDNVISEISNSNWIEWN